MDDDDPHGLLRAAQALVNVWSAGGKLAVPGSLLAARHGLFQPLVRALRQAGYWHNYASGCWEPMLLPWLRP